MAAAQHKLSRAPLPAELAVTQGTCPEPAPSLVEGLSRRALLGAAFAVPLARHPGLDPGPTFFAAKEKRWMPDQVRHDEDWQKALASVDEAQATVLALEGHPDEAAFGRAHDRFSALFRAPVATPAPDITALADKLEIAVAAELADLTYAPPALEALAQDARRLALRSS